MCKDRPANHPSVVERFRSYVEITGEPTFEGTPCHHWRGGKSRGGNRNSEKCFYGTFNPGGEIKGGVRAHVFIAWIAGIIPTLKVPDGMHLDHRCNYALCVNPLHMELVPKLVNIARRWGKEGRWTGEKEAA